MTEHEKLKWICDKIGYEYNDYPNNNINKDLYFIEGNFKEFYGKYKNVREIIFTQEFMNKFLYTMADSECIDYIKEDLMSNLDNPVEYLYNLMKENG